MCVCAHVHMCWCASLPVCGMNESSIRVAYRPTEEHNERASSTLAIDWNHKTRCGNVKCESVRGKKRERQCLSLCVCVCEVPEAGLGPLYPAGLSFPSPFSAVSALCVCVRETEREILSVAIKGEIPQVQLQTKWET